MWESGKKIKNIFSLKRVLILDSAPGKALKKSIHAWKEISNIQISINNFNLPSEDIKWIHEQKEKNQDFSSTVHEVSFDPLNTSKLLEHVLSQDGYDVITTRLNVPFKKPLFESLTSQKISQPLRIIGQAGGSVSHIDLLTACEKNVAVIFSPGANANAVAEFVLAQIFNLTRNIVTYNELTHKNEWSKYSFPPSSELSEKTLGLIGYGHIAKTVSIKARALGIPVIIYSRTDPKLEENSKLFFTPNLDNFLSKADIISVHVPFSSETKHLIGAKEISKMKNGVFIINTSRGGIIDEEALANELKNPKSKIAGVAFDVFENEGSKFQSPLSGCPRTILTPHIAGTTEKALTFIAEHLVGDIQSFLQGDVPRTLANPMVLEKKAFLLTKSNL